MSSAPLRRAPIVSSSSSTSLSSSSNGRGRGSGSSSSSSASSSSSILVVVTLILFFTILAFTYITLSTVEEQTVAHSPASLRQSSTSLQLQAIRRIFDRRNNDIGKPDDADVNKDNDNAVANNDDKRSTTTDDDSIPAYTLDTYCPVTSTLPCSSSSSCFLFTCVCDASSTSSSTTCLNAAGSTSTTDNTNDSSEKQWKQRESTLLKSFIARAGRANKAALDAIALSWTLGFSYFIHLPQQLGRVLELGASPVPVISTLLAVHQRTVTSISAWDPAVPDLSKLAHKPYHTGAMEPHKQSLDLSSRSVDDLDARDAFDTIFVHNVLPRTRNPLRALERIYTALSTGGHLVLFEHCPRTTSGANEKADATAKAKEQADADDPTNPFHSYYSDDIRFSNAALDHLSRFFDVLYDNDETLFPRMREWDFPTVPELASRRPARFLVLRKRALSSVYDYRAEAEGDNAQKESAATIITTLDRFAPPPPLPTEPAPFNSNFYLTWSTHSLQPWRLIVIDSIFYHHPQARVHVYSDELYKDPTVFAPFVERGFSVQVHQCNFTDIFWETPIYDWVMQPEHLAKLNFVSDAMRLAIVYKNGGVYIDFDAIVLRPVDQLRNMLSHELVHGMVNGALLPFDRHHPWLALAMVQFPRRVDLNKYTSGGPALQSYCVHLYHRLHPHLVRRSIVPPPDSAVIATQQPFSIAMYQPVQFFANWWFDAFNEDYWVPAKFNATALNELLHTQYIFHIWKQMLGGVLDAPEDYVYLDSFMGRMFLERCRVLCETIRKDNPGKTAPKLPREHSAAEEASRLRGLAEQRGKLEKLYREEREQREREEGEKMKRGSK